MFSHRICAIWITLIVLVHYASADFEHLVNQPQLLVLPQGYETLLSCEMNIEPDMFQWKFYQSIELYNSKPNILLSNGSFQLIPEKKFRVNRKKSELSIQVKPEDVGEYQCLAYYGASVVASIPWRVTLAKMGPLPHQESVSMSVQAGNTVSWRCNVPESNPGAFVDYKKGEKYIPPPIVGVKVTSMILSNVTATDSGTYKCSTTNTFEKKNARAVLNLEVLNNGPFKTPAFVMTPLEEYTGVKGSNLFLECAAVGKPIPKVTWLKKQAQLASERIEILPGGLLIKNITSKDDGIYICNYTNTYGSIIHQITVKYNEEPSINCFMNTTQIKQGENMDVECEVQGTPEPQIAWFLNGFSVLNDSGIEAIGNKIYFRPIEKRHAGNLQIFARNVVKTVYSSISIRVVPLATSLDEIATQISSHSRHNHRKSHFTRRPLKHKQPKMIPPSRPVISRVNDETVVVRWNVTSNNGLAIQFFKVQYKEKGSKEWNTANTDIAPRITAYEITGLKSEHVYKFRVAAVYSNNDWKMSPTSQKFHLRRLDFDEKNPLPVCLITNMETVNHTSIKVYWLCPPYNVTIDGFYINYNIATRAGDDYMISTVEGADVRDYVINYLQPETSYDIKLQSFNQKLASEFSPLMKGRTGGKQNLLYSRFLLLIWFFGDVIVNPVSPPATTVASVSTTNNRNNRDQNAADTNIYIIIVGAVIGFAFVIAGIILLFVCRKWQKNKLSDSQDKPNVDRHIQADGNEYVVERKSIQTANGCTLPGNRLTITSNPLADADKKFLARIFSRPIRP
ncbi:hypothetical protein ABEB36_013797 [Hypothenemus hampei]|uniref:Interference hedgehog n=1 Tax=Hypothenemus hampei TaxID=57062 RepID=A0ABD1E5H7_HYPHA